VKNAFLLKQTAEIYVFPKPLSGLKNAFVSIDMTFIVVKYSFTLVNIVFAMVDVIITTVKEAFTEMGLAS
jgi:hypothetical protein